MKAAKRFLHHQEVLDTAAQQGRHFLHFTINIRHVLRNKGLVVGCGLGGQTSEVDWKEPRRVLFAVLDEAAYEAAAKEEALDVGCRGIDMPGAFQLIDTDLDTLTPTAIE
ncbi:unnamed protein product [Symbiodinium natans]|uniref:Uncharacterized protein n=1 Tax=Symbiodinium natans TaxID=878477 RepID=A0A812JG66_9DINO|nr:unnamed protein product [Symbiodinium natans]